MIAVGVVNCEHRSESSRLLSVSCVFLVFCVCFGGFLYTVGLKKKKKKEKMAVSQAQCDRVGVEVRVHGGAALFLVNSNLDLSASEIIN